MSPLPCPDCGQLTTMLDRFVIPSTDGPVEHVRILCPDRHYQFTSLAGVLARAERFAPGPVSDREPLAASGAPR